MTIKPLQNPNLSEDNIFLSDNAFAAGGEGQGSIVLPGSPATVSVFEDFLGVPQVGSDTGAPMGSGAFRQVIGDTGHTSAAVAGTNGVWRLFSAVSAAAPKAATAGQGIGGGALQWKGAQGKGSQAGRLRFGARVKVDTIGRTTKRVHLFAGFTDIATFEFPAYDTGAGVISAASDYMGIMLSPGGDTGWSGVAGKSTAGDSGDQVVALGVTPIANTYTTIEMEYNRGISDTGGAVTFWIDGKPQGGIVSPVSPSVALTPVIVAFQQDTGGEFVDIDWVNISAPRDTGL